MSFEVVDPSTLFKSFWTCCWHGRPSSRLLEFGSFMQAGEKVDVSSTWCGVLQDLGNNQVKKKLEHADCCRNA